MADPHSHGGPVSAPSKSAPSKSAHYAELLERLGGLFEGEPDWLANLANAASAVYEWLPGLNWAGFYLVRGGELVVGPFQGRPACVRIAFGAGVCGAAVAQRASQVVPDVHAFPGHIACDPRSRSEIVVPIFDDAGAVTAVLKWRRCRYRTRLQQLSARRAQDGGAAPADRPWRSQSW
ncbi:MAG: GAF domain-containing protein [Deinococcales bacterium]